MTRPEKLPMFNASEAFREIPNLTNAQKADLQGDLDLLAETGRVPNEIVQEVKGQTYRMAKAGDVTFVFRPLSVEEVAQQKGAPSDTPGFMLMDLFVEDAVLRKQALNE